MDPLLEVLPAFAVVPWYFEGSEMDIVLGHEFNKLIDGQSLPLVACKLENQFGLIRIHIVPVFLHYLLDFLNPHLPVFGILVEIVFDVPAFVIILNESPFEFVQFEKVDIFALELFRHLHNLLVELVGVVQFGYGLFQLPLGLSRTSFGLAIPPQRFLLEVGALVGVLGLGGEDFGLGWEGLCCFVVAGLGFNVARLEDVLGGECWHFGLPVGGSHVVHPLCS